jgi:hypothetical protein
LAGQLKATDLARFTPDPEANQLVHDDDCALRSSPASARRRLPWRWNY